MDAEFKMSELRCRLSGSYPDKRKKEFYATVFQQ